MSRIFISTALICMVILAGLALWSRDYLMGLADLTVFYAIWLLRNKEARASRAMTADSGVIAETAGTA